MPYYPKSQTTTNLYTNGKEYEILSTKEEYIGYYWKNSKGKYFTGRTPQDDNIRELTFLTKDGAITNAEDTQNQILQIALFDGDPDPITINLYERNGLYNIDLITSYIFNKNINQNNVVSLPMFSPNIPTLNDYKTGEYRRYFCKKVNEISYLEINLDTYNKLIKKDSTIAFEYYSPFNIPWLLTGDKKQVYKVNKNIVELTIKKQKLFKFDLYLREDYTKYYRL